MQPSERTYYVSTIVSEGSLEREKRPSVGKSMGKRMLTTVD
jgi:hypothetical protein